MISKEEDKNTKVKRMIAKTLRAVGKKVEVGHFMTFINRRNDWQRQVKVQGYIDSMIIPELQKSLETVKQNFLDGKINSKEANRLYDAIYERMRELIQPSIDSVLVSFTQAEQYFPLCRMEELD